MKRIGIIGFGFMGEALVRGIHRLEHAPAIGVIEKSEERLRLARERYGCRDHGEDFGALFSQSELVILAVKPQQAPELLPQLKPVAGTTPVVSVLAGTTTGRIRELLGDRPVIRFMPNIAAQAGAAVVGVSFSEDSGTQLQEDALRLAEAAGTAIILPESQMSAITGLSGSGIAFVLHFIHALALGGTRKGIPYTQSLEAALGVVEGAASVLRESGVHPEEMVSRVCSPGGTTVEGILALEEGGLTAAVVDAVSRAAERAEELER
ncbi:MAG: pyrroline-5-carboxylate reductase [Alkalispirochaetaceae bacterium]